MEVPFDRLGPGQVGRLAYQVLGTTGPIFNPNNIRYMPPDSASISSQAIQPSVLSGVNSATLATGLAGVNLLVSSGTLALTAATYAQCKKILNIVTQISIDIKEMKSVLKDIQDRVKRIDSRVAENNLREAMRHAFKDAFTSDGIDLTELHCLVNDFEGFAETLDAPLIFNFSVRLSSDVKKEMAALFTFLANMRALLSHQHNIKQGGDPQTSVRFSGINDYFNIPFEETVALAFHFGVSDRRFLGFTDDLKQRVYEGFFFASDEEAGKFSQQAIESCFQPIWNNRRSNYVSAEAEALLNAVAPLEIDFMNVENRDVLRDAASSWFFNSDASLLHRTLLELRGIRDGYRQVFYSYLSDDESNQGRSEGFLYECEINNPDSPEEDSSKVE